MLVDSALVGERRKPRAAPDEQRRALAQLRVDAEPVGGARGREGGHALARREVHVRLGLEQAAQAGELAVGASRDERRREARRLVGLVEREAAVAVGRLSRLEQGAELRHGAARRRLQHAARAVGAVLAEERRARRAIAALRAGAPPQPWGGSAPRHEAQPQRRAVVLRVGGARVGARLEQGAHAVRHPPEHGGHQRCQALVVSDLKVALSKHELAHDPAALGRDGGAAREVEQRCASAVDA
eukprot:scaffold103385_cov66-Phaeocystis_antarctica.AAC.7